MREAARLLGAALLAAFMLVQSAAAQTVAPPLEVGIGTREADALGYFAQDLGFFKKVGLDVELQQFSAGPQIAAAIASGHLQIGDSNVISLANSRARGLPFVYICGMNIYSAAHPTALAVVAENSPIKTAKELNGRTVAGVSLASIDQTNMFAWIDKNGGDWQSVKFIEVPPSEMAAALEQGRIAAAIINDPELSAFLAEKRVRVLGNAIAAVGPQFLGNGWIASEEWADAHVETVKKFREAIAMAAVWANAHPDAAAKIFNRYAKTQISRLHARYTSAPLDAKIVQPILDAAAKYKILPRQMSASEILWSHQ
jgi:NitT/TauT family transport system substrate-binding protein